MRQRRDEAEVGAGRRHVDVAARLVRLGLEREPEAVVLVDASTRRGSSIASRSRLTASSGRRQASVSVPSRPPHSTKIFAPSSAPRSIARIVFCTRVGAHLRVVGGEGAVLEDRVGEQVHRRHRHDQAVWSGSACLKSLTMRVALGWRGVDGHEVVVVQVDAPGADARRASSPRRPGGSDVADRLAERVAAAVGDGPEAEGELVLGVGCSHCVVERRVRSVHW